MKTGTGHLPSNERARLRAERAANRALSEKLSPTRSGSVSAQKPVASASAPKRETVKKELPK